MLSLHSTGGSLRCCYQYNMLAGLPHRSSIEVAAAKPWPIRGRAEPAVSFSATVGMNARK